VFFGASVRYWYYCGMLEAPEAGYGGATKQNTRFRPRGPINPRHWDMEGFRRPLAAGSAACRSAFRFSLVRLRASFSGRILVFLSALRYSSPTRSRYSSRECMSVLGPQLAVMHSRFQSWYRWPCWDCWVCSEWHTSGYSIPTRPPWKSQWNESNA